MAEEAHNENEEASAETTEEETIEVPEDFDPERAMRTIKAQRAKEKELADEIARLKAIESEVEAAKAAELEAQKSLEQKLADAEAVIVEMKAQAAAKDVKTDFIAEASKRGIADPALAYLAAKEEGLLGEVDPKTGEVGNHDFEALEEKFPSFAGEAEEEDSTPFGGDAGVRGKRTKRTPGSIFNDSVRGTIQGL